MVDLSIDLIELEFGDGFIVIYRSNGFIVCSSKQSIPDSLITFDQARKLLNRSESHLKMLVNMNLLQSYTPASLFKLNEVIAFKQSRYPRSCKGRVNIATG